MVDPAVPGDVLALRKLLPIVAISLLLVPAVATAASAPRGFIGISPQGYSSPEDFELMAQAGVKSVRLPLFWMEVEPVSPFLAVPRWTDFDRSVTLAATHGMRVFPFVWGTPPWIARRPEVEPLHRRWATRAWASFLRRAARRYGPRGAFWRENPDLPYLPVRAWEIWNEENIIPFSAHANPERFARLIRVSGRVLHRADRGSRVIVGGLFGRPLQVPPNVHAGDFLSRLYAAGRVKPFFDGVALHPYVADARAMRGQIATLRRVMRRNRDAGTRLYLTELGWGSDSFESRWERGLRGQAREMGRAFSMLNRQRRAWRIGGVWWFSWADAQGGCQFCDSAGLLTEGRQAKPSWYRFNAWTGGDPATVPRAGLGD